MGRLVRGRICFVVRHARDISDQRRNGLAAMTRLRLTTAFSSVIRPLRSRASNLSRTSVVMGTTADRENLTDTAERTVPWGAYGPTVATNVATGVIFMMCFRELPMCAWWATEQPHQCSLCNITGLARPCEHSKMPAGIYVNSNFDGGNMDVIDIKPDGHIQLAIQEVLTPNFQLHLPEHSIRHVS